MHECDWLEKREKSGATRGEGAKKAPQIPAADTVEPSPSIAHQGP